ncbi:TatD family hydrolase [Wenyingzhuangia sp. 2_MG-2023]|uniref:TatD family hydrolase n=1 Tax=Wenyingzhuangia sp. 2_MG-2023 TaxID=3062639 RepID=UPI0026E45B6B|nr:TatD family hydrolase [Wenyingzhuangia sp. 2_MG-2023]MDO6736786.1 TatD family hydrolase [Wenyingzhuangia sp. 2_MG-2023]
MIFTDTHTHLNSEQFDEDRNEMIQRALNAGVKRLFVPSVDSEYTQSMFDVAEAFPENIHLMMGVHPTHIKENYLDELKTAREWLETGKFVAVGEIGIDLYWDDTYITQQKEAFQTQVQWAKELGLPINIHCRNAFEEVFEILEKEKSDKLFGIFHCFTGTLEDAKRAIGYNLKLGIGGVATFKNGKIDKFLAEIPLENIVLETDAPYLAPTPFRGKRNESMYTVNVAEKLATIYNKPLTEIAEITTQNSKEVFGV